MKNIATGGADGVALFFLLSGFVLAYNYADLAERGRLDKGEFWKARFARIFPVYILSLVLTLNRFIDDTEDLLPAASANKAFDTVISFLMVVSLTQAWDFSRSTIWNFPAWTLSVELFFYLDISVVLCRDLSAEARHVITGCLLPDGCECRAQGDLRDPESRQLWQGRASS